MVLLKSKSVMLIFYSFFILCQHDRQFRFTYYLHFMGKLYRAKVRNLFK